MYFSINFQAQNFGQMDSSFQPNPGISGGSNVFPQIYSIAIQNDDRILIGGSFSGYNGNSRNMIARINTDGSLDNSFNPGTGANFGKNGIGVSCIAVQQDDKILVSGDFTAYNNNITPNHLIRLNNDGSQDFSFNSHNLLLDRVDFVTIQPNGKILVAGSFANIETNYASSGRLYRLNNDGALDTTFQQGSSLTHSITSLELQIDGKILVSSPAYNNGITRLNTDGSTDETFNINGYGLFVNFSKLLSNGKILIIGQNSEYTENKIIRLNSDGTIDESFYSGKFIADPGYSTIYSVIENNGKIIVGGNFKKYDNININKILSLNSDGTFDNSFNYGVGPNDYVFTLINQNDNKILLGGGFTSFNNQTSKGIVRIFNNNSGGTLSANNLFKNKDLAIYPNPVIETLNIVSNLATIKEINVLNLNGEIIMTKKTDLKSNRIEANLKTLISGNYLLNVRLSNGTKQTHKLIKK